MATKTFYAVFANGVFKGYSDASTAQKAIAEFRKSLRDGLEWTAEVTHDEGN